MKLDEWSMDALRRLYRWDAERQGLDEWCVNSSPLARIIGTYVQWRAWDEPLAPEAVTRVMIRRGYTEADIRDCRGVPGYDAIEVRLWNHRKERITGRELWQNR